MKKTGIAVFIGAILIGAGFILTRAPTSNLSKQNESPDEVRSEQQEEASASATASAAPNSQDSVESGLDASAPSYPTSSQQIIRALKAPDQRKLLILDEIFKTKNDNDPRLDTDLRELSGDLRRALREVYSQTAPEKRNERGTLVFLTARALCLPESSQADQVQDLEFLKSVLMEKPCLSLQDCKRDAPPPSSDEAHVAGIAETTANYPQLTALRECLECYRKSLGQNPPQNWLAQQMVGLLREAQHSPNPKVGEEARLILKYIGQ